MVNTTMVSMFTVLLFCIVTTRAHTERKPPVEMPVDAPSDHRHFSDNGDHDVSYDHEVFLGKDEAKEYDDLEPEVAKAKLREIAKKIDINNDEKITAQELENWIEGNMKRYSLKNTNDRMEKWDKDKDGKISWDEYLANFNAAGNTEERKQQIKFDERRFNKADMNSDELLSREELTFFLHPEDSPFMKDLVAQENMEFLDSNKDGFVSLKEFAGDVNGKLSESLANGVVQQYSQLDKNKDGKLNKEELLHWIVPNESETISNEAMHLMSQADGNMDHTLTYDEMENRYEAFVGSKATHYGNLLRPHPEL